jgi:hypothetical protein
MRFESGVSRQLTTDPNSQRSPRPGNCHRVRGGIILLLTSCVTLTLAYCCSLLDDKAFVTIYFCLIKYYQDNIIEVILE